jgi:hypothetical protein
LSPISGGDADNKETGSAQEVRQLIKGCFEGFDRVFSPSDKCHVKLAAGNVAKGCGCHAEVAAAMQFQQCLYTLGARYDHAMYYTFVANVSWIKASTVRLADGTAHQLLIGRSGAENDFSSRPMTSQAVFKG